MTQFMFRRLFFLPIVLVGISLIVFISWHLIPGDPAQAIGGLDASPETLARIRHDLGLDQPLPIQYLVWLSHVLRGDLGKSIATGQLVLPVLLERFGNTFVLALSGTLLSTLLGLPMGVFAARRAHTRFDIGTMILALAGLSMPVFWLGTMLILLFSVNLKWLPATGNETWKHLILPSITVGANSLGIIARMARSSMLQVLSQDYIRTARSKGLPESRVTWMHALKNALLPVMTVVGLQLGYLLAGAVVTETVFAWPGIGRLLVDAIFRRDFPIMQGAVLLIAFSFVVLNLIVDLTYAYLDPRIRYA
jgi:peptide/nickel transport system permease protein/oligopeptide transport system permease protein